MCLLPSLKWSSTVSSLGIVQWDFTRRDHPGNPGRVSGSGPVSFPTGFLPSKVLMRHILHNGHSRGSVINVNDHIHGK